MAHGGEDGDILGLATVEGGLDLTSEVIRVVGELDVVTAGARIVHEGAEALRGDVNELVLLAGNSGDVGSVGRGDDIFVLLAGEDVNGDEVALGVAVLAGLGGRHGGNLAGVLALHADEAIG